MMLSPKKYVPLRTKVLEMNSKSLEVVEVNDAEEHGLWAFSDGAQGQSTGQRPTLKNGEHSAARGSSCVLERGCFMSTSSLVKVCGDDLVMRTSFSLSVVPASMNLSPHALRARLQHRARNLLPDLIPPSEVDDAQGGLLKQ